MTPTDAPVTEAGNRGPTSARQGWHFRDCWRFWTGGEGDARCVCSEAAALRAEPAEVAGSPEATCSRCHRPNALTWHAPSPLWNAVMRDPATNQDAYGVVCPPCFTELAAVKGLRYRWHFGPHEDVTALWTMSDGRVWDADSCLWAEPAEVAGLVAPDVIAVPLCAAVYREGGRCNLIAGHLATHANRWRVWLDGDNAEPPAPEPLDVERLARALYGISIMEWTGPRGYPIYWPEMSEKIRGFAIEEARRVADEYARLIAATPEPGGTPTPGETSANTGSGEWLSRSWAAPPEPE